MTNTNTLTAKHMSPAIGAEVLIRMQDFQIACRVLDVKSAWGKARFLVEPLAGNGQAWVDQDRLIRQASAMVAA